MFVLINLAEIDQEAKEEKRDRGVNRGFAKDVAGVRAESRFGHSTSHCRAHSTVRLCLLGQHYEDQKQGYKDQYKRRDADENAHVKGSKEQSDPSDVNCRGHRMGKGQSARGPNAKTSPLRATSARRQIGLVSRRLVKARKITDPA